MTFKQKLAYFLKLSFERKLWFLVTIPTSLLVWMIISSRRNKLLQLFMGNHLDNRMLCVISTEHQSLKAWRIARVVEAVCKGVPWECQCLTEAICTNIILYCYKIPSVFYLGSKFDHNEEVNLKAHAWLTVGEYCIIGGQVADQGYLVTATFIRPKQK